MNKILKTGCIVISSINRNNITIIHRLKKNYFSFLKRHFKENKTLEECIIQKTKEETRLNIKIIAKLKEPFSYKDNNNRNIETHCFIAELLS